MTHFFFLFFYRRKCPIGGCPGKVVNLNRHLSQCHKFLTNKERRDAQILGKRMSEIKKAITENPRDKNQK